MNREIEVEETITAEGKALRKKSITTTIILVVICLAIAIGTFCFSRFCLVVYPVEGWSMETTVLNEDYVLLFKTKKVKRGDVIVLFVPEIKDEKHPEQDGSIFLKRVIGLPGDKIKIVFDTEKESYTTYVNDKLITEDYINNAELWNVCESGNFETTVPDGKIFFMGDNRNHSTDSRRPWGESQLYGSVDQIRGIAFIKYKTWKNVKFL